MKTLETILKEQLGNLMFEIAILNSQIQAKDAEISKLKNDVREPDKNPESKE